MTSPEQKSKVVVIGNGWAALGAVGLLSRSSEREVVWLTGTGSRLTPPLPTLDASIESRAIAVWSKILSELGLEGAAAQSGSFLREFRNKAFREAAWTKAPTPQERIEVRNELLWGPELSWTPIFEAHHGVPMGELEEKVRERLMAESEEGGPIRRIDEVPVAGFRIDGGRVAAVLLGSGEELGCDQVVFADRWSHLANLSGLPKMLPFTRKRTLGGALQATFAHKQSVGAGLSEGFFSTLHREAGEEFDRRIWGHFSADGMRSFWTVYLTFEEGEDNHQIAKKLRRMKSALDKMFDGSGWLPSGVTEFMTNVSDEQVRFEEHTVFMDGEVITEPQHAPGIEGLDFLTDGYGPSHALSQLGVLLAIESQAALSPETDGSQPEAEGVNL
jgi:hypothetical protein